MPLTAADLVTGLQLLKLLDHKNTNLFNNNVEALRHLVAATNAQCDGIRDLAKKTQADSRSVKTLTLIAISYLPASLIAVSDVKPFGRSGP